MLNILYTCAAQGASGYSEAARNYIAALSTQKDVNLSVRSATFEQWKTDQSAYASIIDPLLNRPIKPDVQIIHMTPENFPQYRKPGIPNIGYTVWETTALPKKWPALCNTMDSILIPCDWNLDVFRNSGVTVPLRKVEHTIDLRQFSENIPHTEFGINRDKFVFYSILQWTERKNPIGLVRAFLAEFGKKEPVCLIVKAYRLNNQDEDRRWVEKEIHSAGVTMYLEDHASIFLIHKMLSRQSILSLHKQGDCFVLPSRAEGWSCGHFESLAMGNPAIGTRFGGALEFMNDDNSYLVDCNLTPVAGMPWPIYNGKMRWAEPHLGDLMRQMRHVYEHQDEAQAKAAAGRASLEKYSWENIGAKLVKTIKELI